MLLNLTSHAPKLGITGFTASFDANELNLTFTNHTGANIYVKKTNDKSKYLGLTTDELHTIPNSSSLTTDIY